MTAVIVNPYAAWRAECCKSDIEMGCFETDDFTPEQINHAKTIEHRKLYQREYYLKHKRAASLRQQQSGRKEIIRYRYSIARKRECQ